MAPAAGASGHAEADLAEVPRADLASSPTRTRIADDFLFAWPDADVRIEVTTVKEYGEGVTAELAVSLAGRELTWGRLALASTPARAQLVKRLAQQHRALPWGTLVEQACRLTVRALRAGEPLVAVHPAPRVRGHQNLIEGFTVPLGETTIGYGDGDHGKGWMGCLITIAAVTGHAFPAIRPTQHGLRVAYLDAATGLTMADLFEHDPEQPNVYVGKRTVVATYDYVTVAGELRYQAVRYEPKGFSQRRPDPASPHHTPPAWINDMEGVEPLLYRLDKIQQADKRKPWLCICEGERDADALAALGLPATTNHGGAGQWKDAHTKQALGIKPQLVVVFEDNDESGIKRTAKIAPAFLAAGIPVKAITAAELGGLPPKGDISDWLAADPAHDGNALLNIIKETRQYVATPTGSAPRLMTVSEMQSRLGRHTDWLVDRMLAVGDLSLLVAKPGVGKSTFAAQLAVAVAYGKPFLGRAVRQGVVVMLAFEGARSTMAQMVRLGHDPESAQILIWNGEADTQDPVAWLDDTLKGVQPALIIVDTLADLVRVRHGAANAGYEETVAKLGAV